MSNSADFLKHSLLDCRAVEHGFGVIGAREPDALLRPKQVHGSRVVVVDSAPKQALGEADAIVSTLVGCPVGVLTADCVPILLADEAGSTVAAIHAGWRSLVAGVIPEAVRIAAGLSSDAESICAVIGPHIGACCYEVDEPVLQEMQGRFGEILNRSQKKSRPGHAWLDLGRLAEDALVQAGVDQRRIGSVSNACTCCDVTRFHSYRRDGPRAGRLVHFVTASS